MVEAVITKLLYFPEICGIIYKDNFEQSREGKGLKEKKYNANCFHKTYSSQVTLTLR